MVRSSNLVIYHSSYEIFLFRSFSWEFFFFELKKEEKGERTKIFTGVYTRKYM